MDYVAYHSQDVMGNELGDGPPFAMLSRKPVSHLDGQVVWVIEGRGSKKQYFLKQRFIVDLIERIDDDYFRFQFTGQDGISFTPEIPLSVHTWFKDFLKAVANFSIGVSPLKPEFQRRFLELAGPLDSSAEDVADKSDWQLTEGEIQTTLRTYKMP
ncbi:MAG: hypothetical protein NTY19_21675 [Planctomycetota bacterium]|nr:hypothetical protein [Planctomycetota bacterium]